MRATSARGTKAHLAARYLARSQLTEPGAQRPMIEGLPSEVDEICRAASAQTIHHNLLGYHGLTLAEFEGSPRVRPPRLEQLLTRLGELDPRGLTVDRPLRARLLGACIQESYFLVGLLRVQGIPARVRVGYFRNIMGRPEVTLPFWRSALAARGIDAKRRAGDTAGWSRSVDDFTSRQIEVDHRIEHWIAEFWDARRGRWQLVDGHPEFLRAHSGIEVPFRLPRQYFEFAWEAWGRMRRNPRYSLEQHAEEPLDGPTHIRYHLLSDLSSLLNHDPPSALDWAAENPGGFLKRRFADLTLAELEELDRAAAAMARDPTIEELAGLYRELGTLRPLRLEADPDSFL